jgi:hypothetical protein
LLPTSPSHSADSSTCSLTTCLICELELTFFSSLRLHCDRDASHWVFGMWFLVYRKTGNAGTNRPRSGCWLDRRHTFCRSKL